MYKNIALMGLNIFLLARYNPPLHEKKWKKTGLYLSPLLMALPFIIFPPDFIYGHAATENNQPSAFPISLQELPDEKLNRNYATGRHILAFFSVKCVHCKRAAYELMIAKERYDLPEITVFFMGDKTLIQEFFEQSNSNFGYELFQDRKIFTVTDGILPTIFYMNNGKVVERWTGKTFSLEVFNTLDNKIEEHNEI